MILEPILTRHKVIENPGDETWLFLPGGPGMAGSYLHSLATCLALPGKSVLCDFPGCGRSPIVYTDLAQWRSALIRTLEKVGPVGVVAHSFSGMFILNYPEFAPMIEKLVVMNSAPYFDFQQQAKAIQKQHLPSLTRIVAKLLSNPSDDEFRAYLHALIPYFSFKEPAQARQLFEQTIVRSRPFIEAFATFFHTYQFQWVPSCPTWIVGGDQDAYVPFEWFLQTTDFRQDNILFTPIQGAGHFCWMDEPLVVQQAAQQFVQSWAYTANIERATN